MQTRSVLALCLVLTLLSPAARADSITLGALGDSLTDPYAGYSGNHNPMTGLPYWGYAGDKSWCEQFAALRPSQVAVHSHARAGATSADLLTQGQHTALAEQIRQGKTHHAVVMVGANDMLFGMQANIAPEGVVKNLAANLETAVSALRAAGPAAVVIGNIPNLTVAPAMQATLGNNAAAAEMARGMIQAANREISRIAAAHGAPVVDLYRLSELAPMPPVLGDTVLNSSHFFAPDLFHPSTVSQGLIANTILEAFQRGYGMDVAALRLSDEDILGLANLPHPTARTYFDVSTYVAMDTTRDTPEPSTLVLCLAAGVVGLARYGRRWQRRSA